MLGTLGQVGNLRRVGNPLGVGATPVQRRLPTVAQDAILPHNYQESSLDGSASAHSSRLL